MAILEDVQDEDTLVLRVYNTQQDLLKACQPLIKSLELPTELLTSFMQDDKQALEIYHDHVLRILRQVEDLMSRHAGLITDLQVDADWSELVMNVTRLLGDDPWSTATIYQVIQRILALFTQSQLASLSTEILSHPIRNLFTPSPHPLLSTSTSRALQREAGGPQSTLDFHEQSSQLFKSPSGWGVHNVLCFACANIGNVEREIGKVLPPTLVLMDDWEPAWRARGVRVLEAWRGRVEAGVLKRMGVDRLLLKSMLQSLSLHSASPPLLPTILKPTLSLINDTTPSNSAARAELYADVVDKALLTGWMYAPSGLEGRTSLMAISEGVRVLCAVLGLGIVRWLKSIIPALLDPLRYPPTLSTLPHIQSNISALLTVLQTIRGTGRSTRWRGQILDAVARLWAGFVEREREGEGAWGGKSEVVRGVKEDCVRVVGLLVEECPSVKDELRQLLELDKQTFQSLIPV